MGPREKLVNCNGIDWAPKVDKIVDLA